MNKQKSEHKTKWFIEKTDINQLKIFNYTYNKRNIHLLHWDTTIK